MLRLSLALAFLLATTACGGTYGTNPFQPKPSGTVTLSLVGGNGSTIASSPTNPVPVHNGFAVEVHEAAYTNYFTAQIVSYTAPTTEPCYATPAPNNTVLAFWPQSAPPISGVGPSPCGSGDIEGIRVSDVNGHSTTQYFVDQ